MSTIKHRFIKGIILAPDAVALDSIEGEIKVDSSDGKIKVYLKDGINPSAAREVVTNSQTQTLTNKTIDVDNNTVSNIETNNLKAGVLNTDLIDTLNENPATDTQLPSALAVKTYVDNSVASKDQASEISYSNATSGLTATNVQDAVDEIDNNVDNLVSLSGVALDSTTLGTFTGTTIPDNQTVKQALQALETAHEEVDQNANDLISLSGVAENSANLGVFTGTTIPDNQTIKQALQALETSVETKVSSTDLSDHTSASTNVHGLDIGSSVVGTTDSQTLTNKTIDVDNNIVSNIETDNFKAGVLNTSTTLASASDTQLPSALAVKTYVDNTLAIASPIPTISTYTSTTANVSFPAGARGVYIRSIGGGTSGGGTTAGVANTIKAGFGGQAGDYTEYYINLEELNSLIAANNGITFFQSNGYPNPVQFPLKYGVIVGSGGAGVAGGMNGGGISAVYLLDATNDPVLFDDGVFTEDVFLARASGAKTNVSATEQSNTTNASYDRYLFNESPIYRTTFSTSYQDLPQSYGISSVCFLTDLEIGKAGTAVFQGITSGGLVVRNVSGGGGSSRFGSGGFGVNNTSTQSIGVAGVGYGSAGSGAAATSASAATAGGSGVAGIVIIKFIY